MARNNREIERKYLLKALPATVAGAPFAELHQGYLPGTAILERVRRVAAATGMRYYRTIKMGAGIERLEFEEETTELFVATVWPLTRGKRVHKRRYSIVEHGVEWVVDEFLDRPLVLAEIELDRADQRVDLPEWLAVVLDRDVTDESDYTNHSLAR